MRPAPGRAGRSSARLTSCLITLFVPSLPCRSALQLSRRPSSWSAVTLNSSASVPGAPCSPSSRRSAKSVCVMPSLGGVMPESRTVPPHVVQPSHSVSVSVPSPSRETRRKNCCAVPEAVMTRSVAARSIMLRRRRRRKQRAARALRAATRRALSENFSGGKTRDVLNTHTHRKCNSRRRLSWHGGGGHSGLGMGEGATVSVRRISLTLVSRGSLTARTQLSLELR